jgi:NADPH-dependent glutamate synthase beta subunit-like oxidoreductase
MGLQEFMTEEKNGVQVLTAVKTVQIAWEKDEKGAWKMVEQEGTEKVHECDLCILAMGFVGPEKVCRPTAHRSPLIDPIFFFLFRR